MNESIARDWQVALAILKPSDSQLEHGLQLHRQSLVFDTYGFCPRGPVDKPRIEALLAAGASPAELADELMRQSMTGMLGSAQDRLQHQEVMDAAGVDCVFQNAGEEGNAPLRMLKRLAHATHLLDELASGHLRKATSPEAVLQARQQGVHSLMLTTNGVPLLQEGRSVQEELGMIQTFHELGVRMMHLTYNRRNLLGDGCEETADAGLSDFGVQAVREMNRAGVLVDVAHTGWRSSLEAARASSVPIVASHAAVWELGQHRRGKTDEVIHAIVESGGGVGICCVPAFLGLTGDIHALLDHVQYIAMKFGVDSVMIGTDTTWSPPSPADMPAMPKARAGFENFWPGGAPKKDPRWREPAMRQSLAWTNWPLFTVGLVMRGFSDQDIQKILGGNMIRILQEVAAGRKS